MESADSSEGEDVVSQDPPEVPQKTKKKTKEEEKAAKVELHRQALEAFKKGLYPSVNACASLCLQGRP